MAITAGDSSAAARKRLVNNCNGLIMRKEYASDFNQICISRLTMSVVHQGWVVLGAFR